ncbi:putative peptidase S1, PA clan [Plasmopara halstedii]
MHWRAILMSVLATATIEATTTGHIVQLSIGAGCNFSDYSTLPLATPKKPSYHLQLDPGLGKGIYVLHFSHFNLPETDILIARSSDGTAKLPPVAIWSGKNTSGTFDSIGIVGTGISLELIKRAHSIHSTPCSGFTIERLFFSPKKFLVKAQQFQIAIKVPLISTANATESDTDESVCGVDESVAAACVPFSTNHEDGTIMLTKSRSVARLSIIKENGMQIASCTGWLLGCEGHLITNEHCISNNQDARNTKVEFLAEASSCTGIDTCATRGGCPGPVSLIGTTLVAVSKELDYALVRLDGNNNIANFKTLYETTGYLQFRGTGAVMNENIYIPQHPLGYGKRIAWLHNNQLGRVESAVVTECRKGDIGYYIDTQEGSSGSPIIAKRDSNVIALHHCGGCLNGGIPSTVIIEDLTKKSLLPKCAVA